MWALCETRPRVLQVAVGASAPSTAASASTSSVVTNSLEGRENFHHLTGHYLRLGRLPLSTSSRLARHVGNQPRRTLSLKFKPTLLTAAQVLRHVVLCESARFTCDAKPPSELLTT